MLQGAFDHEKSFFDSRKGSKPQFKCFFKLLCQGSKIAIGEADLVLFTSLKWGIKWNLVKIQ